MRKVNKETGRFEPTSTEIRFLRHVNMNGPIVRDGLRPCHVWTLVPGANGYGRLKHNSKTVGAHRFSWYLTYGEFPVGNVCHKCDICVNVDHLFVGTTADNMRDKNEKGRQAKGESQGMSKLTERDVIEIRSAASNGESVKSIHERYSIVNECEIRRVIHCISWRHLDRSSEAIVFAHPAGEGHVKAKLTDAKVIEAKSRRMSGESCEQIAQSMGVSRAAIRFAVTGKTWKHLIPKSS